MTLALASGRRRRHYIGGPVQKRLVIGIVALEIAMTAGAVIFLLADFNAVIDARLYRVHAPDPTGVVPLLLQELFKVILALTVLNFAILVVVDRIWARYVESVLSTFRGLLDKVRALDFSDDAPPRIHHEALDLLLTWRQHERERCRRIRNIVRSLDPGADYADPEVSATTREALRELNALLR